MGPLNYICDANIQKPQPALTFNNAGAPRAWRCTKPGRRLQPPPPRRVLSRSTHRVLGGSIGRPELAFNIIMMIRGGIDPPQIMVTLEQVDQLMAP